MKYLTRFYWVALCVLLSHVSLAQIQVSVNANTVRNDVSAKPFGLNVNTFTDGDGNRPAGTTPLQSALSSTPLKSFLRFPGGEKSDVYMWASGPDYNDPATSGLARKSPNDYPAGDPSIWDLDADTWANDNYNFAEFMADCQALGSEPVVAVALDGIYKAAEPGGTALTYQQALNMAVEWVRYANVTNNYGVKYWLLGNETYSLSYNGGTTDPAQYGRDAALFAQAMKAVDPSILIGINGNNTTYFNGALAECVAYVDFLDVHAYPCFGFDEYEDYRTRTINPRGVVNAAKNAINNQAEPYRSKLFITMSETSAFGYVPNTEWNEGNNIGQALANVDIFGQLAGDNRIRFSQFWNTHWVKEDTGISHGEDFFTGDNKLNASGRLLSRFVTELRGKMVATTSSGVIRVFASKSADSDELTVFLINKSLNTESVRLTLNGFTPSSTVTGSVFRGDSVTDHQPEYTALANLTASSNEFTFEANPLSLTILRFTGQNAIADCTENQVQNNGFETGNLSEWQASFDNVNSFVGVENRTDGFAYAGNHIAFAGGGAASLWQTITGLQPNTDYEFTAAVNYYTPSAAPFPPAYLGVRDYGGTTITRPFTWDRLNEYNWEVLTIPFRTGPTSSEAEIFMSVDAGGTYVWMDEAEVRCTASGASLPVTIQSFSGSRTAQGKHLIWEVLDEVDVEVYQLLASSRGHDWQVVGSRPAHNTSTGGSTKYTYTDTDPSFQLYRLRVVDYDGSVTYSPVVYLPDENPGNGDLSIFPNPTSGRVSLPPQFTLSNYTIRDVTGRVVASGKAAGSILDLTRLKPGMYYLSLANHPQPLRFTRQ